MPGLLPNVDPEGLLEFSVVYTDRALNHMSRSFQGVMKDISAILKEVYGAKSASWCPAAAPSAWNPSRASSPAARTSWCCATAGSATAGRRSSTWAPSPPPTVLKARKTGNGPTAAWAPAPIAEVTAAIREKKPAVVFAPHVETAAGMILPDDYMRAVADAVHAVGGLFVLDCIASGAMWVDMKARRRRADLRAAEGLEQLAVLRDGDAERARPQGDRRHHQQQLRLDLKKWLQIMEAYEQAARTCTTPPCPPMR
jgi:aspartate aminotransferase-like enzyme